MMIGSLIDDEMTFVLLIVVNHQFLHLPEALREDKKQNDIAGTFLYLFASSSAPERRTMQ